MLSRIMYSKHAIEQLHDRTRIRAQLNTLYSLRDYRYDGKIPDSKNRNNSFDLFIYVGKDTFEHALIVNRNDVRDNYYVVVTVILRNSNQYFKVLDDHFTTKFVRSAYKRYEDSLL